MPLPRVQCHSFGIIVVWMTCVSSWPDEIKKLVALVTSCYCCRVAAQRSARFVRRACSYSRRETSSCCIFLREVLILERDRSVTACSIERTTMEHTGGYGLYYAEEFSRNRHILNMYIPLVKSALDSPAVRKRATRGLGRLLAMRTGVVGEAACFTNRLALDGAGREIEAGEPLLLVIDCTGTE